MRESEKIIDKYDIMHKSTPAFARTTIEWDTKRMSKITRNRVIRALQKPDAFVGWGDAGAIIRALHNKFQIPMCQIWTTKRKDWQETQLLVEAPSKKVLQEADTILKAEIVQRRLAGRSWYGSSDLLDRQRLREHFYETHDFSALITAMQEQREQPVIREAYRNALQFIEDGGVMLFTYNPTDRSYF